MPIVVDPGTSGLGTPVTSSDGYLTATPDSGTASVRLAVDFRAIASGAPDRVTVLRTAGGATVPVLGMDGYPSPQAYTVGIDHDAQLGITATYRAVASSSRTGQQWTSTSVAVPVPGASPHHGWIKSTTEPAKSILTTVTSWPDWVYQRPQGVNYAIGAEFPGVVSGKRRAGTGVVSLGSLTVAEKVAVEAVLRSGTLLMQAEGAHAGMRPDVYVEAGDLTMSAIESSPAPWRGWSFPVVQVARPRTDGSRVSLPGHTFADLAARYGPLSAYPTPLIRLLTD